MEYTLDNLEEKYELELDKILKEIVKQKAKSVLIQLPDGLKPWAVPITDYLEKKSFAVVRIFLGDCFGACDVPNSETDLIIQFGHAEWK
jgi:diphthamide biosynthesis enzyme Dph1/Dph2-like protein